MDLKPTLEFGQVPMLEIDDGTKLYQSNAIQNYVATLTGFAPKDPMQIYKGEMVYEAVCNDLGFKFFGPAVFTPAGEARDAKFAEIKEKHFPSVCAILDRHLPADAKFINGDSLTTHDFTVGGMILNLILNPNAKDAAFWAE